MPSLVPRFSSQHNFTISLHILSSKEKKDYKVFKCGISLQLLKIHTQKEYGIENTVKSQVDTMTW